MRNFILFSAIVFASTLSAQPSGMEVVSGDATSSTPQPNVLQVQASDRAIIQWDQFSIGGNEKMLFALPDAASAVLNRVTGGLSSEIMGVLQSNGQVYLVNPQGILVGKEALVDTAGFIASTFDVLNEDFLCKAALHFEGESDASIVNLGTIATKMGDVTLFARHVSNEGTIEATYLKIEGSKALIENSGTIRAVVAELAAGENPYAGAIKHTGKIEATGVLEQNGRVLLVAERVDVMGNIRAQDVCVKGQEIYLTENALIDVSGDFGGGKVRIGFDEPRARALIVTEGVQINADALVNGNGGRVELWGEEVHLFEGTVFARGGSLSGDGGFVDLSTRGILEPRGMAYTTAVNGKNGELLLDPTDITISTGTQANVTFSSGAYTILNPAAATLINITNLQNNLAAGNVTISTASSGPNTGTIILGDSTQAAAMPITWATATTLTLFANEDILIYDQISNTNNTTAFTAMNFTANRDIALSAGAVASGGFGAAVFTTGTGSISLMSGRNLWVAATITLPAPATFVAAGSTTSPVVIEATGSGNVTITCNNTNNGTSAIAVTGSNTVANGSTISTASGVLTINGSGTLSLIAGTGAFTSPAQIITTGGGGLFINTGVQVDTIFSPVPGNVTLTSSMANAGSNAVIQTTTGGSITMNVFNGNLTLTANPTGATASVANIGNFGSAGNLSLYVDGNVSVTSAGTSTHFFGIFTNGANAAFTMNVTKNLTLTGNSGPIRVGNYGSTVGASTMNLTVNGNVAMTGGPAVDSATGILCGIDSCNGAIINIGGNLTMSCGGQASGLSGVYQTQITAGNGGASATHPLNLTVGGNILMNMAGFSPLQQGKTLIQTNPASLGGLNITCNGSITLTAAAVTAISGTTVNVSVGQVYISSASSPMVINAAGDIMLTPGTSAATNGGFTCAQIGDPTTNVSSTTAATITVNAANVILNSGPGGNVGYGAGTPYSAIGYGSPVSTAVSELGAITVNATGTVVLNTIPTTTNGAFTQIGHVTGTGNTITVGGNITVTSTNVFLYTLNSSSSGSVGQFAVIGHGQGSTNNVYNAHTVQVTANRNVVFYSGGPATTIPATFPPVGSSMIMNNSAATTNAITVICDNGSQTSPDYGTGYFAFTPGSMIEATGGNGSKTGQVRIYGSVRVFNTVAASGQQQYTALPINGDTPSALTFPSTLGTNSVYEVWGTWYNSSVSGGAAYPGVSGVNGFAIYYKRTGGLLISDLATVGATAGSTFTFSQTEPRIQAGDILTQLGLTSVSITSETIPNSAPTNNTLNGNSILWRASTAAQNTGQNINMAPNSLTLTAGNDVSIVDALLNFFPSTTSIVTVNTGRDFIVGSGVQTQANLGVGTVIIADGAVNVSVGRDQVINSSAVPGGTRTEIEGGGGISPIWYITRDLVINAAQSGISIGLGFTPVLNIGRNLVQNGGSGTNSAADLEFETSGTVNIGGYHSLNGGAGIDAFASFRAVTLTGTYVYNCAGGVYLTGGSGQSSGGTFGGAAAILQSIGTSGSANWNVTNGNVIMTGGASGNALIQNGTGSTVAMNLNVPNGSIIMQGSTLGTTNGTSGVGLIYGNVEIQSYVSSGTTSGAINVNVGGDIRMTGGAGPNGQAQIRGLTASGTNTSPINLNIAGNLIMQGGGTPVVTAGTTNNNIGVGRGTGNNAIAAIFSSSTASNAVTLNVSGDLTVSGGPGLLSGCVIQSAGGVTATVLGNAIFTGGPNTGTNAGILAPTALTLTVGSLTQNTGTLILTAGTGYTSQGYLQSHGSITVSTGGDVIMTGNASTVAFANSYIGSANINASAISITFPYIGGNVVLTANGNNGAWIGNGYYSTAAGTTTGAITFTQVLGNIVLNGSTTVGTQPATNLISTPPLPNYTRGFAQIGHINSQTETTAGTIGGNISLTCNGSVILNGGANTGARAQIGHGGAILINGAAGGPSTPVTDTYTTHTVTVDAGRNIVLNTTSSGVAQVVNFTNNSTAGNIVLVTDNAYSSSPNSGPGYFSMSAGSFILTAPNVSTQYVPLIVTYTANPLSHVNIYTSVRLFNTISSTINGGTYTAGPLGVNSSTEQWGVYATGGSNSNIPFGLYYKRVGGLLISSAANSGVNYNNGVYSFTKPEAIINSTNLGSNLDLDNVVINSSQLAASPLGSSANSIVATSAIGWSSGNSLTINCSQDFVLDNTITTASNSSGINFNAARNVFIGDAAQTAATGITTTSTSAITSTPVTIVAGGQFNMYGGSTAASSGSAFTMGSGALNITASTGATLQGGALTSAFANIFFYSGNVTMNILGGDARFSGASGTNSSVNIIAQTNFVPALSPAPSGSFALTVSTGNYYMVGASGASGFAAINNYFSGSNTGSVSINVPLGNCLFLPGTGGNATAIVQSALGGITVNIGGNFTLNGGPGAGAFSFLDTSAPLNVTVGGNLSLTAGSGSNSPANFNGVGITVSAGGNISLLAQNNNRALIGNGVGAFASAPQSGNIAVTAGGSITLQGEISGQQSDISGYAHIGHLTGTSGTAILSGNITVTAGDQISLLGGSFNGSTLAAVQLPSANTGTTTLYPTASGAVIGHGDNYTVITLTSTTTTVTPAAVSGNSAVTVTTRGLLVNAGIGAQGSLASVFSLGLSPLTLNVTAGDLYFQGGGAIGASATATTSNGVLTATVNGNIIANAGTGSGAPASIPVSLPPVLPPLPVANVAGLQTAFANIMATCNGSLTLLGGVSDNSIASIGTSTAGTINLTVGTDAIMTSGIGSNSIAKIGGLAPSASPITVNVGGNLLLTGVGLGYANIGNGQVIALNGSDTAAITVTAGLNIILSGSNLEYVTFLGAPAKTIGAVTTTAIGPRSFSVSGIGFGGGGFAQIGHINSQWGSTALSGNISVTAMLGSIGLQPGVKSTAVARVGHGGTTKLTGYPADAMPGNGSITLIAGSNVNFFNSAGPILGAATNANVWGRLAQVVNPCTGNIWIVADNANPTLAGSGTGNFLFLNNGYISTPLLSQVRIYGSSRIFNYLVSGTSVIDGQSYVGTPLPTGQLPQGFGSEEWGYTYATDTTNPFIGPSFTLYYKRVGGILLSSDATANATLQSGGIYAFSSPEAVINTTTTNPNDLLTALGVGNVTISTSALTGTTDGDNSILFRNSLTSSNFTWANTNGLTLNGQTDVSVRSGISQTNATNAALGVTLISGRDTYVFGSGINVVNAPITINAARNFTSMGSSTTFSAGELVSTGTGAGINPIDITAGGNVTLYGGPFNPTTAQVSNPVSAVGGIVTEDANVNVSAGGNFLAQAGYGENAGIFATGSGNFAQVTVSAAGTLTLQGGSGRVSTAELANLVSAADNLNISSGGNMTLAGGWGLSLYSDNDVSAIISSADGKISLTAGGNIALTASPSINTTNGWAEVNVPSGTLVSVTSGGDLTLTAGPGVDTFAAIANSGGNINISVAGNLTINAANDPSFRAGTNIAVIGLGANANINISKVGGNLTLNGGRNAVALIGRTGTNTSNITIQNVSGNVTLNGYSGANSIGFGQAQIGNLDTTMGDTIIGDIVVAALGSITLNGGSTASATARIGHGGGAGSLNPSSEGSVTLISMQGDLTLNSNAGQAVLEALGAGTLTTIIAGNTTLNGNSLVESATGYLLMLTGKSQILNGSSMITNTSANGISIVADNLYPTPPKSGLGRILSQPSTSITSPGPVRLYSAAQQIDVILGPINGLVLKPGRLNINTAFEQWFKYYPQYYGGFPFTFFYKNSLQGMAMDAITANSTIPQFLPRAAPVIVEYKHDKEEEKKKKEA